MFKFGKNSLRQLNSCHKDLQMIFNEVIKHYDCTILEGFRGEKAQNEAFANGSSKLRWPTGKHNQYPSIAVDAISYPIDWNDTKQHIFFAGFVCGIACMLKERGEIMHRIRWGGAWDGLGKLNSPKQLNDLVHFELIT